MFLHAKFSVKIKMIEAELDGFVKTVWSHGVTCFSFRSKLCDSDRLVEWLEDLEHATGNVKWVSGRRKKV
jgi:hypothetical protein